ncbi:hypothetical protein Calow_0806 [Caldicellulosiruptor owensensis OL]|uniref:DUF3800 domain-containing protein n=1 Tax=Caldicellulosiruptor owensensis (strain ATCC 700167 / DSM 13100 / OL) TaxID=632518 RepID=E4Q600_CALOW|nr:DUF3800 domain-containing protein [Caldicellulosiruptor owensensis]ADQ04374.1 hypothetical protein Calow_0806 [Caldicellulosiruptor owensensis OL]
MGWRNRPKFINYCPSDVDYVLFIDESGDKVIKEEYKDFKTLASLHKKGEKDILTLCGVIIHRDYLSTAKNEIMKLKYKYWENGNYVDKNTTKRVCFVTRFIERREKAFSKEYLNDEKYNNFINDLSILIDSLDFKVISGSVNKIEHLFKNFGHAFEIYSFSFVFILERFVKYFLDNDETAIIIFEGRGKKEDRQFLEYVKGIFDNGTRYITSNEIKKHIKGVYFNPKYCDNYQKTYFGLELADLCAKPINRYLKTLHESPDFQIVKKKICGYPDIWGKGLKLYP